MSNSNNTYASHKKGVQLEVQQPIHEKASRKARKKGEVAFCSLYVRVCVILFYLGLMHRPCEALGPGVTSVPPPPVLSQPASATCGGIVTATVTTITPRKSSAATMAITAIHALLFMDVRFCNFSPAASYF